MTISNRLALKVLCTYVPICVENLIKILFRKLANGLKIKILVSNQFLPNETF